MFRAQARPGRPPHVAGLMMHLVVSKVEFSGVEQPVQPKFWDSSGVFD